jgi:hypothetical protein
VARSARLQEQEQIGEAVADAALAAGGVPLLGAATLQRQGRPRWAAADLDAGLAVADVHELLLRLTGSRDENSPGPADPPSDESPPLGDAPDPNLSQADASTMLGTPRRRRVHLRRPACGSDVGGALREGSC